MVRLGPGITEAANMRAEDDQVSRAEVIRRALFAYLWPDIAALSGGAPWPRNYGGELSWTAEFDYPSGGDSLMVQDWSVHQDECPGDDVAPGTPGVHVAWRTTNNGTGQTMSLESAEALGRSLLAAVAVNRVAALFDTTAAGLVEALTGETDPLPSQLAEVMGDPARVLAALEQFRRPTADREAGADR